MRTAEGTRARGSAATALPDMPVWAAAAAGLLVGVPLFTLMVRAGLGQGPVWLPVLGLVVTMSVAQEGPQRLIGGGSLSSRPVLRLVVGLSSFALLLGGTGMTYLLPPAGVLVGAVHIDRSGPRVWRAAAVLTAAFTTVLQVLVAEGLLPSALPHTASHVSALWSLLMALVAIASFGQNAQLRQQQAQRAVRSDRRLRALVENSYDLTLVVDAQAVVLAVHGAAPVLVGRTAESLLGTRYTDLVHAQDLGMISGLEERLLVAPEEVHRVEVRVRQGDGSYRWHEFTAQDLRADPAVGGVVLHQRDVQERRVWQDGLARAADHDGLTGLLNRSALERRLHDRLAAAGRPEGEVLGVLDADVSRSGGTGQVVVLYCDVDRFKQVNDTYGHAVGDQVLVAVAQRLAQVLGPQAELARVGGDEFVAVLPADLSAAGAEAAAGRLRGALAEPVLVGGLVLAVGVSVGLAATASRAPVGAAAAPGTALARLLEQADRRMYEDKRREAPGDLLASGRPHGGRG